MGIQNRENTGNWKLKAYSRNRCVFCFPGQEVLESGLGFLLSIKCDSRGGDPARIKTCHGQDILHILQLLQC